MTKGTKIYMGICAAVLVCTAVAGVLTRFSFQGSTTLKQLTDNSNINQYTIQIFQEDGVDNLYNMFAKVSNYSELEKSSELIAKVKVTDDRKLYSNTINTKVVLEEIYKSDGNLAKNDNIYIYEPAYFEEEFEIYDSQDGYELMESGKEYYVFLNGIKTAEGYKKSEKEKITFLPSTTKFSVYSTDNKEQKVLNQEKIDGDEERYNYGEIKNLNILTSSKNELEIYENIRMELINKIENKGF